MNLLQDLRYSLRSLGNNLAFSAAAIVTLALGIGVATAAYSLTDWLLKRPVTGVSDPDRLVVLWCAPASGFRPGNVTRIRYGQDAELLLRAPALSGLAGYHRGAGGVNVSAQDARPRRLDLHYVTATYFDVLGVRPILGRTFLPEDDAAPDGSPVVVISERAWAALFARDANVVGRELVVDARPVTVIGVLPDAFRGIERGSRVDLWMPGRTLEGAKLGGYYEFVARLAPGATARQAEVQLQAAIRAMASAGRVAANPAERVPQVFRGLGANPLQRGRVEAAARLASIAAGILLLIACANTANLLLFRGLKRRALVGLHKVMGARDADVVRRQLTESLILALPAAAVGGLLATWCVGVFEGAVLSYGAAPLGRIPLSPAALGFAGAVAVVTTLAAGALPAYLAAATHPLDALRATSQTHTGQGVRLRRALGVIQLALSLALVAGASLLVRTLRNLHAVDLGFDPRGVILLEVQPPRGAYSAERLRRYYRELLSSVRTAPGIESAALAWRAPFMGMIQVLGVHAPAGEPEQIGVRNNSVSSEYLDILSMRILVGRWFTEEEVFAPAEAPRKIVISATLARRLFGDVPAVGRQIQLAGGGTDGPAHEVVGVVADTRWEAIEENVTTMFPALPNAMMFSPFRGVAGPAVLLVRSPLTQSAAAEVVQRVAAQVDPTLPLFGVTTMTELIRRYLSERILFARALSALALLAVTLAGVGLYALIGFGVAAQTREFGIRIALGAETGRIRRLVLRESLLLASAGVSAGLVGAVALSRLVQSRLYGVGAPDPATYALAAAVLVLVALGAGWIPARAATRVDPMEALRAQ